MRSSIQIVSAARTQELTILPTVKNELGIKSADRSKDAMLYDYIAAASSMCADFCRRSFGQARVRETFTFDDCERSIERLVLRQLPVVGFVSVLEGTSEVSLVENTDYFLDGSGPMGPSLLARGKTTGARCWSTSRVIVEYTGGYLLLDDVPHSLERACIRLVASMYHSRHRDPNARSVNIPDVEAVSYGAEGVAEGIPLEVQAMLKPFRRIL